MRVHHRGALAIGALLAAAACGRPAAPPPSPATAHDPCAVGDTLASPRDTVRVGLLESVDPRHAPVPTNDAERLVFRQLYEGLVRIDCEGVPRAGLATAWRSSGDTLWTFDLRPGARFWDGTPVDRTAWDGWRPSAAVRQVRSSGPGTITMVLDAPRSISAFADPAWTVVKHIPESPWPLGTGTVWVRGWEWNGRDSLLLAGPTPTAPPGTPVVAFTLARGIDPRDLLDGRVDALSTRDAGVRRYAAARSEWQVVPLAWDRLYVLVSPVRSSAGITTQLSPDTRAALAHDAVRDEARSFEGTPWWADRACEIREPTGAPAIIVDRGRVAYAAPDPVAGDLAGRLVARADAELSTLLGSPPMARLRAVAVSPPDDGAQLTVGAALAFVVALPAQPLDPCRAIARLATAAPWLRDATGGIPAAALAPLVETRGVLLLRGTPHAYTEADGGVRLLPPFPR